MPILPDRCPTCGTPGALIHVPQGAHGHCCPDDPHTFLRAAPPERAALAELVGALRAPVDVPDSMLACWRRGESLPSDAAWTAGDHRLYAALRQAERVLADGGGAEWVSDAPPD